MRRLTSLALFALALTSCGAPPPTVSGLEPGEPCTADAQCQGGLECYAAQCDFTRCDDASDPLAFCGRRLDVPASIARCDSGECVVERSEPGGSCGDDVECTFGSACVGTVCTTTCRVDASCPDPSTRCLPRSQDPGDVSLCQEVPTCDLAQSPAAFCAESLGLAPGLVVCEGSACRALEPPGERDEPCSPDFGCAEGLGCVMDVCSEPGMTGSSCQLDTDCDPSSICLEEICVLGCAGGCPDGQDCFPRSGDAIGYCGDVEPDDCRSYPDPAARCAALTTEPSICAEDGTCEVPSTFDVVRVSFTGTRPQDCEDRDISTLSAPGPLLMGVEFLREDDLVSLTVIASGDDGGYDNDFDSFDLFGLGPNGAQLAYDDGGCPVRAPTTPLHDRVVAIGCGTGFVDLVPVDGNGLLNPAPDVARSSDSLRVRLYDALSCSESGVSPLLPDVQLCRYASGAPGGVVCDPPLLTSPTIGGILATF